MTRLAPIFSKSTKMDKKNLFHGSNIYNKLKVNKKYCLLECTGCPNKNATVACCCCKLLLHFYWDTLYGAYSSLRCWKYLCHNQVSADISFAVFEPQFISPPPISATLFSRLSLWKHHVCKISNLQCYVYVLA